MFDLIRELCSVSAPTGRESAMCALLSQRSAEFAAGTDAFGNFIIHKAGNGKKVMVSAPMDEPSFVVTRTNDRFAYFEPIGPQHVSTYLGKRIRVGEQIGAVGICPVHLSAGDKNSFPKAESLYFQTAQPVTRGDFGTLCADYDEYGAEYGLMRAPAICDRAAMAVMFSLLYARTECDLYLVFASCGRVGAAGVRAAAERIRPDAAILLQPFASDGVLKLADKPHVAVPFIDSGAVHNRSLIELTNAVAARADISTAPPKSRQTAPASSVNQLAGGIRTLMLSIPAAYSGTVSETCRKKDVEALYTLLAGILANPAV